MKLNPDCIRAIMLYCEKKTGITAHFEGKQAIGKYNVLHSQYLCDCSGFEQYDMGEIIYHVIQLAESGYIVTDFKFNPNKNFVHDDFPIIYYITPKGHEFIAKISKDETWSNISKALKPFGSISLSIIEAVSKGVADAAISTYLTQMEKP